MPKDPHGRVSDSALREVIGWYTVGRNHIGFAKNPRREGTPYPVIRQNLLPGWQIRRRSSVEPSLFELPEVVLGYCGWRCGRSRRPNAAMATTTSRNRNPRNGFIAKLLL